LDYEPLSARGPSPPYFPFFLMIFFLPLKVTATKRVRKTHPPSPPFPPSYLFFRRGKQVTFPFPFLDFFFSCCLRLPQMTDRIDLVGEDPSCFFSPRVFLPSLSSVGISSAYGKRAIRGFLPPPPSFFSFFFSRSLPYSMGMVLSSYGLNFQDPGFSPFHFPFFPFVRTPCRANVFQKSDEDPSFFSSLLFFPF